MRNGSNPIGIFDSGLGGLTVLREIEKILPQENIVYFGDTARLPYGSKSKNAIIKFSTQNVLFLLKKKVKMVVIACNTSSSLALDYLKSVFRVPVLGVIDAGVQKAVMVSGSKKIAVIGTKSTIGSGSYQRRINALDRDIKVYAKACPLFVPLAEEGLTKGEIVSNTVRMYLKSIRGKVDTLILGCTHYPILKNAIAAYLKGVYMVDSAKEVALKTKVILEENSLINKTYAVPRKEFYVTDEPKEFMKMARIFLKRQVNKPRVVNV